MKDGGFLLGGFLSFVFDDHSNGVGDQFVWLQINKKKKDNYLFKFEEDKERQEKRRDLQFFVGGSCIL